MSENKTNPPLSELQQKAIKFLETRWLQNERKCEICGHKHWVIQEHIVTPIVLQNNSLQLGGISYPQVMAVCSNCTNTKYFNAVMMGLIEKKEDGEKDAK
jgi:hypothetical protein